MPVNRRDLLAKVDKMIAAENASQPLGLIGNLANEMESIVELAQEEIPGQSQPLDLSDIDA